MRDNDKELNLDVSHLEPCEPMERILETLPIMTPGQYLRVLHSREPFPLYNILQNRGFEHCIITGSETPFELFIWKNGDDEAHALVRGVVNP